MEAAISSFGPPALRNEYRRFLQRRAPYCSPVFFLFRLLNSLIFLTQEKIKKLRVVKLSIVEWIMRGEHSSSLGRRVVLIGTIVSPRYAWNVQCLKRTAVSSIPPSSLRNKYRNFHQRWKPFSCPVVFHCAMVILVDILCFAPPAIRKECRIFLQRWESFGFLVVFHLAMVKLVDTLQTPKEF